MESEARADRFTVGRLLNLPLNSLMATEHPVLFLIKITIYDFLANLSDATIRILLISDPFFDFLGILFVLCVSLCSCFFRQILLPLLNTLRQFKLSLGPHGDSPAGNEPDEHEHEDIEDNHPRA